MTIEIKKDKAHIIYSLLTSVQTDKVNPNILYVKVSEEMNKAFAASKIRFINVERMMKFKSELAVEFSKFLQLRGQGIQNNEPTSPQEFSHSELVFFLHLEHLNEKQQIQAIRRAIKAVTTQGFSNYKLNRRKNSIQWIKTK